METNRIKLKDFLTLFDEDTLVEIIYHHISECGYTAKELFLKRPELENTYISTNGIDFCRNKLDNILANNSDVRKEKYFKDIFQNEYVCLFIYVED